MKGWENLDCRIPLGDKFGAAGREACAPGWGRLPKSDDQDATRLEVGEDDEYGRGQTLSLRDPEKVQVEMAGRLFAGGDGELARKQEETKQEKGPQAQGHEETGQGNWEKTGRDPGRGRCVRAGFLGRGRQGRNRLDWNEQARFLLLGGGPARVGDGMCVHADTYTLTPH